MLSFFSCKQEKKQLSNASINKLDKVAAYLQEISLEGFSGTVLVDYKGELFSKGYGENTQSLRIPNTEETVYDIGSITKQFTAAGILKLEMMGLIKLDSKLPSYFNHVPEDKKDITIHQLLTHSSGLIDWIGDDYDAISTEDFLKQSFTSDLLQAPGKKYHYSNVGYSLLALIIEKVSGQSYEGFLSEQLFIPAGMKLTGYSLPQWDSKTIATGYHNNKPMGKPNEQNWDGAQPYLHLKGNGGILSTVSDMYKWHQALLNNEILDASAKKKYYHPHIKEDESGSSFYGYGWAIFPTPRNTQLITHNGGNGIFFADFLRYLTEDITIILLSNKSSNHTERVAMQIAGVLLVDNFEPLLPSDIKENEIEEALIDDFVQDAFLAIRDGGPETWESLLQEYASEDFLNAAPMETHISFFSKFKERMQGGKLLGISVENDEIISDIQTPEETFRMILTLHPETENELKLDGILLN